MITDDARTRGPALLGCTAARSVWLRTGPDGGATVHKRFDAGPIDAAARELAHGRAAAGPGVVEHLGLATCPVTGRPELLLRAAPGGDLARRLENDGPWTPAAAVRLTLALGATLARLHAIAARTHPRGLVHGDVKPANVLFDAGDAPLLADFEHSAAVGAADPDPLGFTGGTHGWSPPECYAGAPAAPARDVFGLAATTLATLLGAAPFPPTPDAARRAVGRPEAALAWLDGAPPALVEWLAAGLAPCDRRPPLGAWLATAAVLDASGELHGEPVVDFLAWQAGDAAAADRLADRVGGRPAARLRRRAAVARRLAPIVAMDRSARGTAGLRLVRLAEQARAIRARARWFPRDVALRALRAELRAEFDALLPETAGAIAARRDRGEIGEARRVLAAARALLTGLGPPRSARAAAEPSPWTRRPHDLLDAAARELDRDATEIDAAQRALADALGRFDLAAAARAVHATAERHGGSRPWVARLRDRLHRAEFYFARLARLASVIDDVLGQCRQSDLDTPTAHVAALRDRLRGVALDATANDDSNRAEARPRPFLRALRDVVTDVPEAAAAIGPAADEFRDLLGALTDHARQVVAESARLLDKPPIPIRPLEQRLLRLDALALADVLVDRPGASRDHLIDEIESLRGRVEQARAARDRIARGAREAMDRGHLTTAIFDIERAVDQFGDGDAHADDGPSLAQQFEEARRRKQRLELALQRNHELAAECARLATAPDAARVWLARLQEREEILRTLVGSLPADRASGHADDLRAIHLDMLRAMSGDGERRLELLHDAARRLDSARKTLAAIQHSAPDPEWNPQDARLARDILAHWQSRVAELDPVRGARTSVGAPRRSTRTLAFVASLAVLALLGSGVLWMLDGPPAAAAHRGPPTLAAPTEIVVDAGSVRFDTAAALRTLDTAAARLRQSVPAAVANAADATVAAVAALAAGHADLDAVDRAAAELDAAAATLADPWVDWLGRFAQRARRAGFATAAVRRADAELGARLDRDAALRAAFTPAEVAALRAACAGR